MTVSVADFWYTIEVLKARGAWAAMLARGRAVATRRVVASMRNDIVAGIVVIIGGRVLMVFN